MRSSGWGSAGVPERQPEPMRAQHQRQRQTSRDQSASRSPPPSPAPSPLLSDPPLFSSYLDEEGHEAEFDPPALGEGPELRPQRHQAAQVDLVTVAEVRDHQSGRHRLHHRFVET